MAEIPAEALDALAWAISERLQAVVPTGAFPNVSAGHVGYQLDILLDRPGVWDRDDLAMVSANVLDDAQDQITRDLKEGWPWAMDGTPDTLDSAKDLPMPGAAVVSGELRLWYGDAEKPALELQPIGLAELGVAAQ